MKKSFLSLLSIIIVFSALYIAFYNYNKGTKKFKNLIELLSDQTIGYVYFDFNRINNKGIINGSDLEDIISFIIPSSEDSFKSTLSKGFNDAQDNSIKENENLIKDIIYFYNESQDNFLYYSSGFLFTSEYSLKSIIDNIKVKAKLNKIKATELTNSCFEGVILEDKNSFKLFLASDNNIGILAFNESVINSVCNNIRNYSNYSIGRESTENKPYIQADINIARSSFLAKEFKGITNLSLNTYVKDSTKTEVQITTNESLDELYKAFMSILVNKSNNLDFLTLSKGRLGIYVGIDGKSFYQFLTYFKIFDFLPHESIKKTKYSDNEILLSEITSELFSRVNKIGISIDNIKQFSLDAVPEITVYLEMDREKTDYNSLISICNYFLINNNIRILRKQNSEINNIYTTNGDNLEFALAVYNNIIVLGNNIGKVKDEIRALSTVSRNTNPERKNNLTFYVNVNNIMPALFDYISISKVMTQDTKNLERILALFNTELTLSIDKNKNTINIEVING